MKERPIIFTAESVRAILDGRKTQTRRVVKHNETMSANMMEGEEDAWCPHGGAGDRLWIRETWRPAYDESLYCCVEYRADGARLKPNSALITEDQGHRFADDCPDDPRLHMKWRSPRFMPRWASRITLEITDVRVERVQEISTSDCYAEGIAAPAGAMLGSDVVARDNARTAYRLLWDSINTKRPGCAWADNPWVWALTFRGAAK